MRRLMSGLVWLAIVLLPDVGRAQEEPAPNDYADPGAWLCLPGRQDACAIDHTTSVIAADGSVSIEPWAADPTAPVDCFYVYPTVSTDPELFSDMEADFAERNVIAQQFARFASVCRPFAPMYRQVTLAGLRARTSGANVPNIQLNVDDVIDAWRHYLAHENDGRGVILIGHSQGSSILRQLIAREIDGKSVQSRMISAMLIGMTIPVRADGQLGGAFQHIPVCRSATQTGCLISYASYRSDIPPPENARFGAVPEAGLVAACTNPAQLARGSDELHGYLSAEGQTITNRQEPAPWVAGGAAVETPWVSVPGLLTGRCTQNRYASYLEVTVNADPSDPRTDTIVGDIGSGDRIARDWGLHLVDINIAMGDLIAIAERQAESWLAAR